MHAEGVGEDAQRIEIADNGNISVVPTAVLFFFFRKEGSWRICSILQGHSLNRLLEAATG
jgi:hypothetical protein